MLDWAAELFAGALFALYAAIAIGGLVVLPLLIVTGVLKN